MGVYVYTLYFFARKKIEVTVDKVHDQIRMQLEVRALGVRFCTAEKEGKKLGGHTLCWPSKRPTKNCPGRRHSPCRRSSPAVAGEREREEKRKGDRAASCIEQAQAAQ